MKKIYIERVNSQSEIGGMIIDCSQASFKFNRLDGYLFATKTIDAKSSGVVLIKVPDWSSKDIDTRRKVEFDIVKNFAAIYDEFYQSKNGVMTIRQTEFDGEGIGKAIRWDFILTDFGGDESIIKSYILM